MWNRCRHDVAKDTLLLCIMVLFLLARVTLWSARRMLRWL
jgi:hypothetical protein